DHWMYGIRLELPFETADIGDGKGGFWGHIKDAFKPRRRHLAERLYESAHARHLEPQIAVYVSKATLEVQNRFRGAIILPDGTVLRYSDSSNFSVRQTTGGSGTVSIINSSSTSNQAGFVQTGSSTLILSGNAQTIGYSSNMIYSGAQMNSTPPPVVSRTPTDDSSGVAIVNSSGSTGAVINLFDWSTVNGSGTNTMTNFGSAVNSGSDLTVDTSRFGTAGGTVAPP
ncbi:MAG: inverse autotransporter beta-barrel protein, partial [Verrucomicrobiaceae bacterium]|nr:inverse autotransporter beta-barrel protein [Verrucomicrobiaceae bacterium]